MQDGGIKGYWILPFLMLWMYFAFAAIYLSFRPGFVSGLMVPIYLMILFFLSVFLAIPLTKPSDPGPNRYGPNPHEVTQ